MSIVQLKNACIQNGIPVTNTSLEKLMAFLNLLQKWNQVFNLTSIHAMDEMIHLHVIDSLIVQPYLQGSYFLDVGSGGGLPGIPLAIIYPDLKWVLLDKNSKKTRFLSQAKADLNLHNVSVVHSRIEDFQPAQGFDTILSRAFSTLDSFASVTYHLLAPDGLILAMKGKYPQDELNELSKNFVVQDVNQLKITGLVVERHIVRIKPVKK